LPIRTAVLAELEDKQRAAAKEYAPKMQGVRKCGFIGEPVGEVGARTFYGAARIGDLEVLYGSQVKQNGGRGGAMHCCCIGEHFVGNILRQVAAFNLDWAFPIPQTIQRDSKHAHILTSTRKRKIKLVPFPACARCSDHGRRRGRLPARREG
jgi:hypothetical protein